MTQQGSSSPSRIKLSVTLQVWPSIQDQQDGGDVEDVRQGRYAMSTVSSLREEPGVDFVSVE